MISLIEKQVLAPETTRDIAFGVREYIKIPLRYGLHRGLNGKDIIVGFVVSANVTSEEYIIEYVSPKAIAADPNIPLLIKSNSLVLDNVGAIQLNTVTFPKESTSFFAVDNIQMNNGETIMEEILKKMRNSPADPDSDMFI